MLITDQQLRAFIKVAEFNFTSLSAAAQKLNITPQALGKTIMNLESELGTSLFVRTSSNFSITNTGLYLLPQAQALYHCKEAFLQKVQKICEKTRGRLYLAAENGVIIATLSPEAAMFSEIYFASNLETCVDRLNKGLADLIYSRYYPEFDTKLCYIPVVRQRIQVLLSKSHPLAEKAELSIEDLRDQNILELPRIVFPSTLTKLCIKHGFNPNFLECVSIVILINLLKHNAGIALFPPSILEECDLEGLVYRPIDLDGEEECNIGFYAKDTWESNARLKYIIQKTIAFHNSHTADNLNTPPWEGSPSQSGQARKNASSTQAPRITERQMRVVVNVADLGNLSKAAKKLSISQQAASKSLFSLEQELGVELFTRLPRHMKLTEVGAELLPLFRHMLEELDAWYAFAAKQCANQQEKIVVALETRSMQIAFPFYKHPQLLATINTVPCSGLDECLEMLREGRADIVYCMQTEEPPGCRYIPVLQLQPVVLMNENHPLATRESLSIADLQGEKFAIFEPKDPFNLRLQNACRQNGFYPDTIAESYNEVLLVRLVRANRCIMVLPPPLLTAISMQSLTAVPLCEPGFLYSTGLLVDRSKKLSPAMKQFIRYFQKHHEGTEAFDASEWDGFALANSQ